MLVSDKGLAGRDVQAAVAGKHLTLVRPAGKDEPDPGRFPNWLRQRVEAIIWTLKHQLGWTVTAAPSLGAVGSRPAALARLNAAIWFNWQIGATPKRSLIADDH